MSTTGERMEEWGEANAAFLTDAVDWIARLLERRIGATREAPAAPTPAVPARPRGLMGRLFPPSRRPREAAPGPPAVTGAAEEDPVAQAKARMEDSAGRCEPGPGLWLLARQFRLDDFETAVVLLLAAMELNTRIGWLCGQAMGNPDTPYPTFALALSLFEDAHWAALAPDRALRSWRLVELHGSGPATPMIAAALKLDERVLNYLKGLGHLDERLAAVLLPSEPGAVTPLAPSQEERVGEIVEHWRDARGSAAGPPVVQLVGGDGDGKWQVARRAASAVGRGLYRLPAENLLGTPVDLDTLARLWEREVRLSRVALYVDAEEAGGADPEAPDAHESARKSAAARFLSRGRSNAFLAVADPLSRLARASVIVEVTKPTTAEQAEAWSRSLGLSRPGGLPGASPVDKRKDARCR